MKVTYSVGAKVPGGGIGNVASHALQALSGHGYLKKAFLTGNNTTFLKDSEVETYPWLNRIPSYLVKDNLFDFLVSRQVPQANIFHGWNNFSLLSLRQAKKKGAQIIIERASSHIVTQNNLLKREMKKFKVNFTPVNPLTLKKSVQEYLEADFVFVPSQFAYDSFLENGYPKVKLRLIHFGVDIKKFTPQKNKKDNLFRAIFVGQVGIRKGLPYLLQAWQELDLKDSELLLIGPIFPDFKDLIKNYNLRKIRFIDYSNNLTQYYQESDLFVFPSIEEGSALVTYEAMAAGLPLIVTHNSGSLVADGQEGFIVETGSVESLKQALLKFYNNRDLLVAYSKKAREKIEKFTWENYERNLIKTYEEIGKTR